MPNQGNKFDLEIDEKFLKGRKKSIFKKFGCKK